MLEQPAALIGSIETVEMKLMTYDDNTPCLRSIQACPAVFSLFNELVCNATDNKCRDGAGIVMTTIRVDIDEGPGGAFKVTNDGAALSTRKFNEDLYQITVAFGRFQAGTNFKKKDNETGESSKQYKHTIGQNGVGSKGTNVFSREFTVCITNADEKKTFQQKWENNMKLEGDPMIERCSKKNNSTTVSWVPDWEKLNMPEQCAGLTKEIKAALESLVYHASLCTPVRVFLNGKELTKMKTPQHFIQAFGGEKPFATDVVCNASGQPVFSICCASRPENMDRGVMEAFVNGTRCPEGTHVDMMLERIRKIVLAKARKKDSDVSIKTTTLRNEMVVVATMLIDSPSFDSQLKTNMDTRASKFGFSWEPSTKFKDSLEKSPIVQRVISASKADQDAKLQKTTKLTKGIPSIAKYEPAMHAGKKGVECSLILCEGDSAKGLAIAGLTVIGRENYGVFPLKGKLLNTRNMSAKKLLDGSHPEVSNLIRILGLEIGKVYDVESAAALPYRWVLTMTDQDVDGDHIQGLILNMLTSCFPSLFKVLPDFVRRLATPVIRVTLPGGSRENFFSEVEYHAWREQRVANGEATGTLKYYKGLGTSTAADARLYFGQLEENSINILHTGEPSDVALDEWFDEKKAACRRDFLQNRYDAKSFVDYSQENISIEKFIHDGLSHFSHSDNRRSIPDMVDGLKPSQRKVLFCVRDRNLTTDVKVAQLQAIVAERTAYHHGEVSLGLTIIGMACDYTFTNNVSLIVPSGSFGTRHAKNDAASVRYIYTRLDAICNYIYRTEDDAVLEYNTEDGHTIEPVRFVPIVPMILINGASGIGTGWRTDVPCFNPVDVIEACEFYVDQFSTLMEDDEDQFDIAARCDRVNALLHEQQPPKITSLLPWYRNFNGQITDNGGGVFSTTGVYEVKGDDVVITELPVNTVTDDYYEDLRKRVCRSHGDTDIEKFCHRIDKYNSDTNVLIILRSSQERIEAVQAELPKLLKIKNNLTARMNLFPPTEDRPVKCEIQEIFYSFGKERLQLYGKRIAHQIRKLEKQLRIAHNKSRYIKEVRDGTHIVSSFQDEAEESAALVAKGYSGEPGFDYLLHMRLQSLNEKKYEALQKDVERITEELEDLKKKTPATTWRAELTELRLELSKYEARKAALVTIPDTESMESKKKGKRKRAV